MRKALTILGILLCNVSFSQTTHDALTEIANLYEKHYEQGALFFGSIKQDDIDSKLNIANLGLNITDSDTINIHVKFWFYSYQPEYVSCIVIPDTYNDDYKLMVKLVSTNIMGDCTTDKSRRVFNFGDIVVIRSIERNKSGTTNGLPNSVYYYSIFKVN